jgi:hypothetical protein
MSFMDKKNEKTMLNSSVFRWLMSGGVERCGKWNMVCKEMGGTLETAKESRES